MRDKQTVRCPICAGEQPDPLLYRDSVPVHQNYLFASSSAARAIARGTLDLRACSRCQFVFNAAFDADLLAYGPQYENTQTHSTAFSSYVDDLVTRLVEVADIRDAHVLEVGCGKGGFLRKLLTRASAATALGYDPAYVGPDVEMDGRLRFVRQFYNPTTAVPADIVICRHVIEHIPDPVAFIRSIRAALGATARTKVFLETPCVRWILEREVSWDFFYEHCSLFTAESLETVLTAAGFHDVEIRHVFGEQYLWAEATTEDGESSPHTRDGFRELAARFREREGARLDYWGQLVQELKATGTIAVWGAGAKGVTFCNLTDPQAEAISAVVDVNPAKQGMYLAGSGHRIIAPQQVAAERIATVLVLNPNYKDEIANCLASLGAAARVLDLMRR